MNDLLRTQFETAYNQAQGAHASDIVRDCLPIFVRMAELDPSAVRPAVLLLKSLTTYGYGNGVPALYCLLNLADVSSAMLAIVYEVMGEELIDYLSDDKDEAVSGNARILKQLLGGAHLSDFRRKEEPSATSNIYNLHNSNLAIGSPNTNQSLILTELDDESRVLLLELTEALKRKDKSAILKTLSYIGDKSVDLLVSLIAAKGLLAM